MKISIAMTTYNGEKYLLEQLESFLIQERKPDELVICDDGSTYKTLEILNNFSEKAPFDVRIYKNKKNLGYSKNFEKAISLCTGDIIFLSDQDDIWFKNKIKEIIDISKVYSDKKMYIHDALITDSNLKTTKQSRFEKLKSENKSSNDFTTGCLTAFKKELKGTILPIPKNIKFDIWINKIGVFTENRIIIKKKLQYWRRHKNNTSSTNAKKITKFTFLKKKIKEFFKHENNELINNLEKKKANIQIFKERLNKKDYNNVNQEIIPLTQRIEILKKPPFKKFFFIFLFLIKGGYSNFNGIWTFIKDLFLINKSK
jgi:glycosyltransferase involved in cell wall biosynthesis